MTETPILTAAQALEEAASLNFLGMTATQIERAIRALAARIPPLDGEVAGVVERLKSGAFTDMDEKIADLIERLSRDLAAMKAERDRRAQNMREQWEAFSSMWNDLSEIVPLPSLEQFLAPDTRPHAEVVKAVAALRAQLAGAREAATIDGIPWEDTADWSSLPTVFVTKVQKAQGMFWRGEFCSVPMAVGPEVALIPDPQPVAHDYTPSMDPNDQGECTVCGGGPHTRIGPASQPAAKLLRTQPAPWRCPDCGCWQAPTTAKCECGIPTAR